MLVRAVFAVEKAGAVAAVRDFVTEFTFHLVGGYAVIDLVGAIRGDDMVVAIDQYKRVSWASMSDWR